MSLFTIFDIAGSGLSAQNTRLNVTASNIANAESVAGSPEKAYKSRHPVFASAFKNIFQQNSEAVGVNVTGIIKSDAEHPSRYTPSHPFANEKGYIYQSNVNVMEEMANMTVASRNYQTNVEVMNTSKQLLLRTLSLGE